MTKKWIRYLFWHPFESLCRKLPLVPFKLSTTIFDQQIVKIQVDNVVTKAITKFGGGYDYSVCYLISNSVLIDTGFPWARRSLRKYLLDSEAYKSIEAIVNTHAHEDHVGNNDLLEEITSAPIYAHPIALGSIRHPDYLPWYRNFMFGPGEASNVKAIPDTIEINNFRFEIIHTPGHSPDHICIFEPDKGWLFSGDLYVSADLDSQLSEVDGNDWINSLSRVISLKPKWLFDAHGKVVRGEAEIEQLLSEKLSFLTTLRDKIYEVAKEPISIREITKKVFNENTCINQLSFSDGWLSLLTSSDFTRSNIVKSFLKHKKTETKAVKPSPDHI